ncbi:MAG: F0F1 ATP synthase subunit epsilon [Burkholderiales bacterium]|nr:F0F1 ATP synthase subunit epsilon [Burkholderiales bacterium]
MAMTMQVEIVSAEESFYSGPAEFVAAPSILGEVGIYPRHAPMLTRIKPGSVRVKRAMSDEEDLIYVSGGILEVQPDIVTVLADSAIRGADLDEAKAQEAKLRAQDAMKNREAAMEFANAEAELAEAIAQLAAIEKLRKKR